MNSAVLVVLTFLAVGEARKGFGPSEQDWGHVTVREGAHMFWWLFFTTADVKNVTERPLVVWLQDGSGRSSSGYGNFAQLGPLDLSLKNRNYTWIKDVNILFVDAPVGTGFSYVEDISALAKTNREMAEDFVKLMRGFYVEYPEFEPVPLYIVSQFYGGKIAAEIALVLAKDIERGNIISNFRGVGFGNAWIDPVTMVLEWAPYLFAVGAVDQTGHDAITTEAEKTKEFCDQGLYKQSYVQTGTTLTRILTHTGGIDFNNILKPTSSIKLLVDNEQVKLIEIMTKVQKALGLNVTWGAQSVDVIFTLAQDFMKPVRLSVEEVLNTTNITVAVFTGQLGLYACTPGTVKWVHNLQWLGSADWATAGRQPFAVNGINDGFEKNLSNLRLYWVNRAGHFVPSDNPAAMDYILRKLTSDYDGTLRRH